MHKHRIYFDTSVIGGCFDEQFSEWSNKLFDEFCEAKKIAVISQTTLDEFKNITLSISCKVIKNIDIRIPREVIYDEQGKIF